MKQLFSFAIVPVFVLSALAVACGPDTDKRIPTIVNDNNNAGTGTGGETNTTGVPDTCGDGVVVAGEVCDGNCPTSCDDQNACTTDAMSGRAELCNVVCINEPITACVSGDGCCAPGCTVDNDDDCTCEPKSCADVGAVCGTIDDGCGGTVQCGACGDGKTCNQGQCETRAIQPVGAACGSDADCDDICADLADFPDGFCTAVCESDFDCAQGTHCVELPRYNQKLCMPNCQADNDCQSDDYRCWDADNDSKLECAPAPRGDGDTGDACERVQDCSGLSEFCAGPNEDWPGGYCSTTCWFNGMCPYGTFCWSDAQMCVSGCETDADCRTGYTCVLSDNGFGTEQGLCL